MENLEKYDLNDSFAFLISRTHSAMNRRLLKNFKDSNHPITSEQYTVMLHLWDADKRCQRELCCATGKDKPGITRILDKLEKLGYVERIDDSCDRRMKLVQLTESGKALEEKSNELALKTLKEFLEDVDCKDVELVKDVLKKIIKKFEILE
jgi:DNA-binding MarR family transcriptional regulator